MTPHSECTCLISDTTCPTHPFGHGPLDPTHMSDPNATTILPITGHAQTPRTLTLGCTSLGCNNGFSYSTEELYGDVTIDAMRQGWTEEPDGWRCPPHRNGAAQIVRCAIDTCTAFFTHTHNDPLMPVGWGQFELGGAWACPAHNPYQILHDATPSTGQVTEELTAAVCAREAAAAIRAADMALAASAGAGDTDARIRFEQLTAIADLWINLGRNINNS